MGVSDEHVEFADPQQAYMEELLRKAKEGKFTEPDHTSEESEPEEETHIDQEL